VPNPIEVTDLTKRYGPRRGVESLGFSVREGEVFGFLGPNGAGKTTTIRVLLGFLRPTAGSCAASAPAPGPWGLLRRSGLDSTDHVLPAPTFDHPIPR
jgi:ABC-2 type transport system ATP-binding protein